MQSIKSRSDCPIGKTLDIIGDKWSLLIMRHVIFAGATTYKELSEIPEGIASNILAERLDRLDKASIIRKLHDPSDGRKSIYKPTTKGVDLMPVLLAMIDWGMKYHDTASYPESLINQAVLNKPKMLEAAQTMEQGLKEGYL